MAQLLATWASSRSVLEAVFRHDHVTCLSPTTDAVCFAECCQHNSAPFASSATAWKEKILHLGLTKAAGSYETCLLVSLKWLSAASHGLCQLSQETPVEGSSLTGSDNAEAGPSRPRPPTASPAPSEAGWPRRRSISPARRDDDDDAPPPKRRRGRPSGITHPAMRHFADVDGLAWYNLEFKHHLKHTRWHYMGRPTWEKPWSESGAPDYDASVVIPSLVRWSPAEKGMFYAALARHSRLRPDLIAMEVPTKTKADVVQYLAYLEASIETLGDRKGLKLESREWRNHLLGAGAYEVDPEFAETEEELGDILQVLDRSSEDNPTTFGRLEGRLSRYMSRADKAAVEMWGKDLTTSQMDLAADVLYLATVNAGKSPEDDEEKGEDDAIARDNEQIDLLLDIPKKDRTVSERSTLQMLLNRRSMRQRYRRKQLIARGWTDAAIDRAGGPDAVFVAAGRGGAKRKGKGARLHETHPEVAALEELGVARYFENRGWELFNYDRMAQFIELYQDAYSPPSEREPGTTFAFIAQIYGILHAYLKLLMQRTITLAEVQGWPAATDVTGDQVNTVLEFFGARDPVDTLKTAVDNFSQLSRMAAANQDPGPRADTGDESAAMGAARQPPAAEDGEEADDEGDGEVEEEGAAEGNVRADAPPLLPKPPLVSPRRQRNRVLSVYEASVVPPRIKEPPPDADLWILERTITDDEDEVLDNKLEEVDAALDKVMNYQLHGAVETTNHGIALDDRAWIDKEKGDKVKRGRGWKAKREAYHVPEDAQAELADAQKCK